MSESFYATSSDDVIKFINEWLLREKQNGCSVEIISLAMVKVSHSHFEAVVYFEVSWSE